MKKYAMILTLLTFTITSGTTVSGQTPDDHDKLLRISLEVTEMISENHKDHSGKAILAIVDNGKISKSTRLTWFETDTFFATPAEIKSRGLTSWVEFTAFDITSDSAMVTLLYHVESSATKKIELKFSKSDTEWLITASNIVFM